MFIANTCIYIVLCCHCSVTIKSFVTIMFFTFLFMPILLLTDEVLALKTTQHVKHVVCCHFNRANQGNSQHTLNNNSGFSLLGLTQAVRASVTGCFAVWLSSQHAIGTVCSICANQLHPAPQTFLLQAKQQTTITVRFKHRC